MQEANTTDIAIVGAGLAGLYAAWLLEQAGTTGYRLLEARSRTGGRIASLAPEGFDLGSTWFWPEQQPALDRLVHGLGLARFAQHEAGDLLFEPAQQGVQRVHMPTFDGTPTAMRLAGGMSALLAALRSRIDGTRIATGQPVRRMQLQGDAVVLQGEDAQGHTTTWQARHVLLALPPRLAARHIAFTPALPPALAHAWHATPTWMAPHAKYLAVYAAPFWRAQGLSGQARSARGPLGEIHDASMPGGRGALFGFFGLPARMRHAVPDAVLRSHCRAQLARLFGPGALEPEADTIQDWAADPLTATAADADADFGGGGGHGNAPQAAPATGPWQGRITGIASEWSPEFPGYLAGAIDAAQRGVNALLRHHKSTPPGTQP